MVHVCEKYALEFNITFNGNKNQLMLVGGGQHKCDIYVGGNKVDIVTCMRYLGHTVTNDINDSLVKPVINDFNVKVFTFLAYFNDVVCDITNTLFNQYCTGFYGSHLRTLFDRAIEDLYIAWRKAQRRVWGLPYMTHCRLLPHVTDLLPGDVLLSKRFLKHFVTGYCNKNSMVSTVFRSSMCYVSWLGNNIGDVCFKNDIDLHSLHTSSISEMNNIIISKWLKSVSDEDKRVGMHVLDLCIERDSLNKWVFERGKSLIL